MKDLSNSKIWIGNDPELSEKVQKKLFELGYSWSDGKKESSYKEYYSLYIRSKGTTLMYSSSKVKKEFNEDSSKEIFLSDLFEEEWIPKVGEIWRYDNRENYIINSFHSNGIQVSITPINSNDTIKNYPVDYFKNKWIKISSNQEEDLSKVPYTEWRVGDTITPFQNWDDNGGLTADKEYIITKFSNADPYMIKNDGQEDWSRRTCFKLIKRASQDTTQDDFVLPNEWYVTVTEENKDILSKWRNVKLIPGKITGMYLFYGEKKPSKEHDSNINGNWKNEITFEQFQKYVLKTIPNNLTNNNLNKQENANSKQSSSSEQGIKIRRSNISISEGVGIRGSSIKSTRSKIYIGSNNSYNK